MNINVRKASNGFIVTIHGTKDNDYNDIDVVFTKFSQVVKFLKEQFNFDETPAVE